MEDQVACVGNTGCCCFAHAYAATIERERLANNLRSRYDGAFNVEENYTCQPKPAARN
jgi:hypothetical protein